MCARKELFLKSAVAIIVSAHLWCKSFSLIYPHIRKTRIVMVNKGFRIRMCNPCSNKLYVPIVIWSAIISRAAYTMYFFRRQKCQTYYFILYSIYWKTRGTVSRWITQQVPDCYYLHTSSMILLKTRKQITHQSRKTNWFTPGWEVMCWLVIQ